MIKIKLINDTFVSIYHTVFSSAVIYEEMVEKCYSIAHTNELYECDINCEKSSKTRPWAKPTDTFKCGYQTMQVTGTYCI
jgi:hypothetical protein